MTQTFIEKQQEEARKEIPCWDSQCNNRGMTTSGVIDPNGDLEPLQCEFCARRDDAISQVIKNTCEEVRKRVAVMDGASLPDSYSESDDIISKESVQTIISEIEK